MQGINVAHLIRQFDEINKETTKKSAFVRGIRHSHFIQVPLERFELALDLATPLTSLKSITVTISDVVRSVTAVSKSIANVTSCVSVRMSTPMLLTWEYVDCY